ncbi:AraC family transcriptional regulator [Aquimarina macrocephali]|uniref:AraC family transcriptional regulator n=1 Tax=Aquimarina macrocephali TaxID=666563 RepID=UPI000466E1FE|nr:AraC family transcriptional regulator [Aquimarina macrocephali]
MHKLFFYILTVLLCQNILYGQNQDSKTLDSLIKLEYKGIRERFYDLIKTNSTNAGLYAEAYLQKGKNDKDALKITTGLYFTSQLYPDDFEKRIIYIDSAISMVKKTNNHEKYLVILKNYKGTVYETAAFFDIALDDYLESLELAKKTKFSIYISIIQHNIAIVKRKFGKHEEAKLLFKKCLKYEKLNIGKQLNDSIGYLITLSELVTTYRQNKELDSAYIINNEGMKMADQKPIQVLFRLNEGILQYYDEEYKNAIKKIDRVVYELLKPENEAYFENYNLMDAYFFLGKSYDALSKREVGVTYYKKIDSLLQKTNYLIPKTRSAYLEIIKYYKSIDDKNNQLYYINKLLYNDSIIDNNFKDVNNKLIKEYDTPILLSEKVKLINELQTKNNRSQYSLIILLIFIGVIITGFILYYKKNKKYRIRFEELINQKDIVLKDENTRVDTGIGIANDVVEMILEGLNNFEKNNGFLKTNLTSGILATKLNTNSKYLTKVIKYYQKKTFTTYINDLRIDYIIDQLKTDSKLQKYTIKALASEAGFNSTEVFSKSFHRKAGIYPSYFVKKIKALES